MTRFSVIAFFIIILDQISKHIARRMGLVHLNYGVSFGMVELSPWVLIIGLLIVCTVCYQVFRQQWLAHPVTAGIFFGAALSNILDRIVYGGVQDWLRIPFTQVANNLADWLIFLAIIRLLFIIKVEHKVNNEQ